LPTNIEQNMIKIMQTIFNFETAIVTTWIRYGFEEKCS